MNKFLRLDKLITSYTLATRWSCQTRAQPLSKYIFNRCQRFHLYSVRKRSKLFDKVGNKTIPLSFQFELNFVLSQCQLSLTPPTMTQMLSIIHNLFCLLKSKNTLHYLTTFCVSVSFVFRHQQIRFSFSNKLYDKVGNKTKKNTSALSFK